MTQELREIIGWIAAGISFLAYLPYIVEFVGGRTKTNPLTRWMWKYLNGNTNPHQATWFVWAALQYVIFSSMREQGVSSATTWIAFGYLLGSSMTALFLFWYGEKRWNALDISCGILAFVSLVLLYYANDPFWALVFALIADAIAAIPTIIGVTKNPRDESRLGWSIFSLGALINIFAIQTWNFQESGFTIYLIFVIGYITAQVWRPRRK